MSPFETIIKKLGYDYSFEIITNDGGSSKATLFDKDGKVIKTFSGEITDSPCGLMFEYLMKEEAGQ